MKLSDKIIVITGGTKGIGKATAIKMHALGGTVVLVYGSDKTSAEATAAELKDRVMLIQADLGQTDKLKTVVDQVVEKYGRIDILINNAAALYNVTMEDCTPELFDKSYNLNVKSPWFLTQAALPHIPSGGKVLFVSTSLLGHSVLTPNYGLYCSTKGAIEQMVRIFAKEFAPKGIIVNAVAPGPTATEMFYEGKSEQVLTMMKNLNPFKRFGTPEEVAEAFVMLALPENTWICGQTVRCNGGFIV